MPGDFTILITNYLRGHYTTEEENRINKWLEESRENRRIFDEICDVWYAAQLADQAPGFDTLSALNAVKYRIGQTTEKKLEISPFHKTSLYRSFRIAVIFILAFVLGTLVTMLFNKYPGYKNGLSTITAPLGSKTTMTLPDGTRIWLNAGSTLKYTEQFNRQNREVDLEGEAYFDVAKNSRLPFIVAASNTKIKAVGTAFNVKAYPEEKRVETTLVKGLIEIERTGFKERILLKPNQKIIFFNPSLNNSPKTNQPYSSNYKKNSLSNEMVSKNVTLDKEIDTEIETCWKDGKLIFEREPLINLVTRLERRYDVHFTFTCEKLKTYKYTGTFNDVSLEQIMEAMSLSSPVNYEIKEKQVELMEKP